MAKGAADVCGMITFCLCGPKGSLCCFVLSIWGSIMLVRVCVCVCVHGGGGGGGGGSLVPRPHFMHLQEKWVW